MKTRTPTIKTLLGIIIILAIMVPAGLFIPRWLFAQEVPPQLGHGALHKVETTTVSKCEAVIATWTSSNKHLLTNIRILDDQCAKLTGEEIAADTTTLLQQALDKCQKLTDLPADDPDKTTDPKTTDQKSLTWDTRADDTYLCSSPVKVTITWDGKEYNLSWRSTNAG